MIGTGWWFLWRAVVALILFWLATVLVTELGGLWPFIIYLSLFAGFLHVTDEGYEARQLDAELAAWLRSTS